MAGLQGSGKTTTIRQAGRVAQEGRSPSHAGFGRRLPPRRARAAQSRRQVRLRRGLYEGDLKGEPAGSALVERLAKEARREAVIMGCDTLIVDTAGRLHVDQELMAEMEQPEKAPRSAGDSLRRRRHDRPGRGQLRAGFSRAPRTDRSGPHQNGRRRPRRRGALDSPRHRPAHQVHRRGRKAGRLRALSSRSHCGPHPGHGRHALAHRKSRIHARPQEDPRSWPRRPCSATAFRSKTSAISCKQIKKLGLDGERF